MFKRHNISLWADTHVSTQNVAKYLPVVSISETTGHICFSFAIHYVHMDFKSVPTDLAPNRFGRFT